ncbi:hypothetical protein LY78DRAFT_593486 [Colletotrichum sublineola]|nr:hypothetical protein LY78DRAFT_593486 [Colletotrichum sublineola]
MTSPPPPSNSSIPTTPSPKTPATLPFTNIKCNIMDTVTCPKGSDNLSRCLNLDYSSLCITICPSESTCPADCKQQGHKSGFCCNGDNPCICTDLNETEVSGS